MKISYLSTAAAVLAIALTQASGAGVLTLNGGIGNGGTITGVSIDAAGNITVTGTAAGGGGGGGGATTAPSSCTIGANTFTPTAGGSSILSVNCTGGSAATSYSWTSSAGAPTIATGPTNPVTVNFPTAGGPFTYSATASNSAGSTNTTNNVSITVSAQQTGNCPAALAGTIEVPFAWNPPTNYIRTSIKQNEIRAYSFTTSSVSTRVGSVALGPNTSTQFASKLISLSRCPGDFSVAFPCKADGIYATMNYAQGATGNFDQCRLELNTRYYLNIRNGIASNPALDTCSASTCSFDLQVY